MLLSAASQICLLPLQTCELYKCFLYLHDDQINVLHPDSLSRSPLL